MITFIELENIIFQAYHGVFPQENAVGNTFIINLKIKVNLSDAFLSDNIEDTLNYAQIYEIVKEEMDIPSKLMEHVAARIVKRLKNFSDKIEGIELKISKQNPPMGGQVKYASILLTD